MYTRPLWGKQSRKSSLWTRKSPSCIILGLEPTFSFTSWQPPLCAHFWTLPIHVSPNRALMRTHGRKDYTCLTPTSAAPAKEPCSASSSLATDLDFHSAHPPTPIPQIGAIHPWAKNRVLWSKNCPPHPPPRNSPIEWFGWVLSRIPWNNRTCPVTECPDKNSTQKLNFTQI